MGVWDCESRGGFRDFRIPNSEFRVLYTLAVEANELLPSDEGANGPAVDLEVFAGPLDLLLHLIKQNQVSIYDIPIVEICDQYHRHLDAMQELDLDVAGEFLWMASWLLQLKSRMLLPRHDEDGILPFAAPDHQTVKRPHRPKKQHEHLRLHQQALQ